MRPKRRASISRSPVASNELENQSMSHSCRIAACIINFKGFVTQVFVEVGSALQMHVRCIDSSPRTLSFFALETGCSLRAPNTLTKNDRA